MDKPDGIHWLPDDEYQRAVRELLSAVGQLLKIFDGYGMGTYIPEVSHQIVGVCEKFALRVRGVPKEIKVPKNKRGRN